MTGPDGVVPGGVDDGAEEEEEPWEEPRWQRVMSLAVASLREYQETRLAEALAGLLGAISS